MSDPAHERDREAIRRVGSGEVGAIGEIAARHERALLGLAKGLLGGSEPLAQEAVQDTWVRAIRGAAGFAEKSEVRTWLWRIAINRCRDIARWERLAKLAIAKLGETGGGQAGEPRASAEDTELVRRALMRLPVVQREAVVLCCGTGMSHSDAADVLGERLGTVKSRIRLGLARLRKDLGEELGVDDGQKHEREVAS